MRPDAYAATLAIPRGSRFQIVSEIKVGNAEAIVYPAARFGKWVEPPAV